MTDIPPPRAVTDTHDFAPYVRILGRGPGKSRSLTREEARHALGMVLRGEATREQVGAMLMLLRYRGEAIEEMAGLVEAARAHAGLPLRFAYPIDLDWPSYADGRTRGLPWYLLSALLVARAGLRVLMHGSVKGPGRAPLVESLKLLGEQSLETTGFAFIPLETLCPALADLLALRGVLGLRSPLNTVCRLLNPADARGGVDGVFHPNYIAVHIGTAGLLGRDVAVLKGGGGEAEWSGAKPLLVTAPDREYTWPALDTACKPESTTPEAMKAVWDRRKADPGGETTVIATAAVALQAAGWAKDPAACLTQAKTLWDKR